jgi:hypothetical protein
MFWSYVGVLYLGEETADTAITMMGIPKLLKVENTQRSEETR